MKVKSVKSLNHFKSVVLTSYDIIKAHGGELKVETPPAGRAGKEGEGSVFIITIPFKN
jgi:signal transduction histidine kinase